MAGDMTSRYGTAVIARMSSALCVTLPSDKAMLSQD